MKKIQLYTVGLLSLFVGSGSLSAQVHHDSDVANNIIKFEEKEQQISIKAGGRLGLDAAHYLNDKMDMGSGAKISEARLNVFGSYRNTYDVKIDIDFGGAEVTFRDVFVRWNINDHSSLRFGHYVMPFSLDRTASALDRYFIAPSGTVNSLTLGRRVGVSYRAFNDKLWGSAGVFAGDGLKKKEGDDGWGVSTRVVFNPQLTEDLTLHIGGGFAFRRPDANGFDCDGDDDYNRYIRYASNAETNVDKQRILNAYVEHAHREMRYNAELLLLSKKFFIQSEYTGTTVSRKRDNYRLWEKQLGGMWSHQTLEAWENWYGKDLRDVSFNGMYVQAGFIVKGGDYKYNRYQAMHLPGRQDGTIELVARYNHTNLNDVDGIWYAGKFWDPAKGPGVDDPNFNYSIGGGRLNSYGLGINYYFNKYARLMLNYNYQQISSFQLEDKYAHVLQAKMQIAF